MSVLSVLAEKIKGTADRMAKEVAVPEWGETLRVRVLSARERLDWEKAHPSEEDKELKDKLLQSMVKLVVLAVVDADGNRVFSDADASWLVDKSFPAVERLFNEAARHNAITKDDHEGAAKN